MKRKNLAMLLILTLLVASVGVAEGKPTTIALETPQMVVRVGSREAIELRVSPHAAREAGVSYRSNNEAIATVDERGRVSGVAAGECRITIASLYDASVTASVPVQVIVPVSKLTPDAGAAEVRVGDTLRLAVGYEPEDATDKAVTYESSRESVATVSPDGLVTGVKRGTAEIILRSTDGYATARQKITVLQPATSVAISAPKTVMTVGKSIHLKAQVEPKDANNRNVVWASSDEEIATVDERGRVTSHAPGEVVITVACADDPSVSDSITLEDEQLAESVAFDGTELVLNVGESVPTAYTVLPADTSNPAVTFEAAHPAIADVDAQGVVTGLKAGKTTLYVRTTDGTRHHDHMLVTVCQPVEGVAMERGEVRVGVGYYTKQKAVLQPEDATDRRMTWTSSDEAVATVNGDQNVVTIRAHQWGECVVTGVTEDGGFSATIAVHGGSYNHAVKVVNVSLKEGKPHLTLENESDLTITRIDYEMRGYDAQNNPVALSLLGPDTGLLVGSYDLPLTQGERTQHGRFTFNQPTDYAGLERLDFTVTGFETEDGFAYRIPEGKRKTVQYCTALYLQVQGAPQGN